MSIYQGNDKQVLLDDCTFLTCSKITTDALRGFARYTNVGKSNVPMTCKEAQVGNQQEQINL